MELQRRVSGILMNPRHEWTLIAQEPADVVVLYRNYILILAAIPAAAIAVARMRFGVLAAVAAGLASYALGVVQPLVAAIVVEKLAPKFLSTATTGRALQLVAYAATPLWVVGVVNVLFFLVPLLLVAGIYGVYLFYLGLPVLLQTPLDRAVPFVVVTVLAVLVANVALEWVFKVVGVPPYFL
jgi:hypothetical protein